MRSRVFAQRGVRKTCCVKKIRQNISGPQSIKTADALLCVLAAAGWEPKSTSVMFRRAQFAKAWSIHCVKKGWTACVLTIECCQKWGAHLRPRWKKKMQSELGWNSSSSELEHLFEPCRPRNEVSAHIRPGEASRWAWLASDARCVVLTNSSAR